MPYSYREIPESELEVHYFEHEGGQPVTVDELVSLKQFEILDEDGDQITIVHSETEAEVLVSHLNRYE